MSHSFKEEARKVLEKHKLLFEYNELNEALTSLQSLHQAEIKRIIGEDKLIPQYIDIVQQNINERYYIGYNHRGEEQRKRAGL